jgi:hypothetical protein
MFDLEIIIIFKEITFYNSANHGVLDWANPSREISEL